MIRAADGLEPALLEFLRRPGLLAIVATYRPDGSIHQAVAWYRVDGDAIVLNSADGRLWPTNLRRDPRCSVMVADGDRWVSLRGEARVIDDQPTAQGDIAEMARRYHRDDPDAAERDIAVFRTQRRVSFVLRPTRVHADLEG